MISSTSAVRMWRERTDREGNMTSLCELFPFHPTTKKVEIHNLAVDLGQ